ncbi:MAG: DMT family transporter [Pseudomonadota bacterium]
MRTGTNFKAIALMVFAMVAFGIDDAAIKVAGTLADGGAATPGEIIFIKGVIGALVFGYVVVTKRIAEDRALMRRMMKDRAVILRTVGDLFSAMALITGLTIMPISNLSAILQVQPLMITLGAALILGEHVGWRRWSAVIVGFIGVMLIIRPGMAGFEQGSEWAILAMLGLAVRDLATRVLEKDFPTSILITVVALLFLPLGTGMHFAMESEPFFDDVSLAAWALILGGGVFGLAGYYAITVSVRIGEISVVAPYRYTRLLAALVLGFFIFNEVPDLPMAIGALLVTAAGLFTLYRERALASEARDP